jgi:hypothetical protein
VRTRLEAQLDDLADRLSTIDLTGLSDLLRDFAVRLKPFGRSDYPARRINTSQR